MIKIKKGLDLPITGKPDTGVIENANAVSEVALIGYDYPGMKPTMKVQVGDKVQTGDILFEDKKMPVLYTSPGAGEVIAVNRGAKRVFESIVIRLDGSENAKTFSSYSAGELETLGREKTQELLLASGMWTSLRTRPFGKVANPENEPMHIFVNAMDSNPLASDPSVIIEKHEKEFLFGLKVLKNLTKGNIYLTSEAGKNIPGKELAFVKHESFSGPHPSGLVGTHIHFLNPVGKGKMVWHLNYQDTIAIGILFTTGKVWLDRYIALGGPSVSKPRILKTRLGAKLDEVTKTELNEGTNRILSGSVLSGRKSAGNLGYLGRYHLQISCLPEGGEREFLGWSSPGLDKFSTKNIFLSNLLNGKKFSFDTDTNGSKRAMVPIGMYEKVMPLDIDPTYLLRSLMSGDSDLSQELGCLELEEEDLGLCTFVCPGKEEYAPLLRQTLEIIEKEG